MRKENAVYVLVCRCIGNKLIQYDYGKESNENKRKRAA